MDTKLYLITPQTNMHVGSGDIKYGIIDKYVQRDAKTEFPIINSSSLKGAIREYIEEEVGWGKEDVKVKYIFGSQANGGNENSSSGKYRFFTSELLAIPVRCLEKPYFLATCPSILKAFVNRVKKMRILALDSFIESCEKLSNITPEKGNPLTFGGRVFNLEDFQSVHSTGLSITEVFFSTISKDIALFSDEDFKEIVSDLPVIARNHLEDGISDNLWYEEIIPHQSVFYSFVGVPTANQYFEEFNKALIAQLIQIGANASIGYGFCEFKLITNS